MSNFGGRRGDRAGDRSGLAGGFALAAVAGGLLYLLGSGWLVAPASGATPPAGVDPGPLVQVRDSPQHLVDQIPSERYYNAIVGDPGAGVAGVPGDRAIGIRPDQDERRMGYVAYTLSGGYRTLSTVAGISAQAPAGTRERLQIFGDDRLLAEQVVGKGETFRVNDLDVTGVDQLRLVAASEHPPFPGVQPEAVFADPVLR